MYIDIRLFTCVLCFILHVFSYARNKKKNNNNLKNKLLGILKNVDYFIFSASYLAMQHLHIATHGVLSDWL